uniref:RNA-dependent RNA polymerase n=1 Tax=Rhizoctonia solani beny-like virus 2 TaxID=2818417 RepID=A0AAU7PEV3_9VIRU
MVRARVAAATLSGESRFSLSLKRGPWGVASLFVATFSLLTSFLLASGVLGLWFPVLATTQCSVFGFYCLLIIVALCHLREFSYRSRCLATLEARCASWVRNHGKVMRRRSIGDHCWALGVNWASVSSASRRNILMAYGPMISRSEFAHLLELLGPSLAYEKRFLCVENSNHLVYWQARRQTDLFDVPWNFLALDAQTIINTSAAVNATALGNTEALKSYKKTTEGALKLHSSFTPQEELMIQKEANVPVLFCGGSPMVSDHVVLAALRVLIRQQHENINQVTTTKVPTLVVGSAAREANLYADCDHIHHYFHASETKDYSRTIIRMLSALSAKLKSKTNKKKEHSVNKATENKMLVFRSLSEIAKALADLQGWGNRFFSSLDQLPQSYERLVFEDVYELGPKEYMEVFRKTGANGAVGYGFYPDELVFPDCAPSKHYAYHYNPITGKSSVAYRYGVSNGYEHDHAKWASFLLNPVMRLPEFKLVFEITSRIGPYLTYSITKMPLDSPDYVVRRFELREKKQFVRVLDVKSSVNAVGGLKKLNTFAVLREEWDHMVNFALSLDPKSLTFANIVSQVRRVAGGVSLVNKELTCPWELPKHRYADFALAVVIYARRIARDTAYIESIADAPEKEAWRLFLTCCSAPFTAISAVVRTALSSNIADHIVQYPDNFVETRKYAPVAAIKRMSDPIYRAIVSPDGEKGSVYCDVCADVDGKLGDQLIQCKNTSYSGERSLVFEKEERDKVINELMDENCNPNLLKVKLRAREYVPKEDSHHTCQFHYIEGGPGSGKSYLIRLLAQDAGSVVYVPFGKLVPDYHEFKDPISGQTRKLPVATIHKALIDLPVCDTLFVDEFTAMDWRYIKMLAIKLAPKRVYLVGDVRQTRIQEPQEGLYVGNHADIETMPTHKLIKNFRNPGPIVHLVNRVYDCGMMSASKEDQVPRVVAYEDYRPPSTEVAARMTFSHKTAEEWLNVTKETAEEKYTVRSFQGSTYDNVVLYLSENDGKVVEAHGMNLVALTRHKKSLTIVHDGSAVANAWLDRHYLLPAEDGQVSGWQQLMETSVLPSFTEADLRGPYEDTAEDDVVKSLYAQVEEVLPQPDGRRLYICLSKPQILVGLLLFWKIFGIEEHVLSNILVTMTAGSMLGVSLYDAFVDYPVFGAVLYCYRLFKWFVKYIYLTPTAIYLAFRAPGSVTSKVVAEAATHEYGQAPLLLWLEAVLCPAWLRSQAVEYVLSLPVEYPKAFATKLHMVEMVPGFEWARSVATVINHFAELPSMPSKVLRSLFLVGPCLALSAACLYRTRNATPIFALYLVGPNSSLHAATSFLSALHIPDVRLSCTIDFVWSFEYVVPEGYFTSIVSTIDFGLLYVETAGRYFSKSLYKFRRYRDFPSLEKDLEKGKYVTPRDAYLGIVEGLPAFTAEDISLGLNTLGSALLPSNWRSGTLNVEAMVSPFTKRGHPVKLAARGFAFARGIGHTFLVKSVTSLVNVCGSRYLNPKAKAPNAFGPDAIALASAMVQEFFTEHMSREQFPFDDDVFARTELEADLAAKEKKYEGQLKGIDDPDYRLVRMHLKDIYKPSPKKKFDDEKPGQGISAWSKDAQVTFGTCIRYFNTIFQLGLRPHVVYDNRKSVKEVMEQLNTAMGKVPEGANNGVTDFTMFDSQQDEFTQEIEKQVLYRLGASEEFVAHYYSNRKNYKISAGPLFGKATTEKTSGEPGTLLFNSIVNVVIMNFLLRGEGPVAMAVKGDDGFKRQCKLHLDEERKNRVAAYTRLTMKLSFEDPAEFCGCTLGMGIMAPNLYRRLNSVTGRVFKDYKAFADYQTSLRDWLSYILNNGVDHTNAILAINTLTFAQDPQNPAATFPAIESVLHQLVSVAHISEEQFNSATRNVNDISVHFDASGQPVFSGLVPDPFLKTKETLSPKLLLRKIRNMVNENARIAADYAAGLRQHKGEVSLERTVGEQIRRNDEIINELIAEAKARKLSVKGSNLFRYVDDDARLIDDVELAVANHRIALAGAAL